MFNYYQKNLFGNIVLRRYKLNKICNLSGQMRENGMQKLMYSLRRNFHPRKTQGRWENSLLYDFKLKFYLMNFRLIYS